jgi:transcriptional regulator with XRE-family HTH domain
MFSLAKLKRRELTQQLLMDKMCLSRGLFNQWVSGITRIPDIHLLFMAQFLEFDPLQVRGSLVLYGAVTAKTQQSEGELMVRFNALSAARKEFVLLALEFAESKSFRHV